LTAARAPDFVGPGLSRPTGAEPHSAGRHEAGPTGVRAAPTPARALRLLCGAGFIPADGGGAKHRGFTPPPHPAPRTDRRRAAARPAPRSVAIPPGRRSVPSHARAAATAPRPAPPGPPVPGATSGDDGPVRRACD